MKEANKKEIQLLLKQFIEQFPSQAQAVGRLKNVSEATIIQMLKDRWESISDDKWRTVGKQVGWNNKGSWNLVETLDFKTLVTYFSDAKDYSNVFAIVGSAGSGKSAIAEWYGKAKPNVYHITCADYWNRKMFLAKLLEKMGKENTGYNIGEMMDVIVETLLKQDRPLIILDEADKLKDEALYFFITLYNMLKGKCGMVLMATEFLSKRIMRGFKFNRKGFPEILSRIGRRFIQLHGSTKEEVKEICEANGIDSPVEINEIFNDYDGDLRRVERMVHKIKIRNNHRIAA
jgi:DNA transposition AAA+ family ATPase